MLLEFSGEIFFWRGPSPFYFVRMADAEAAALKEVSNRVTYGWGCIPVDVTIGGTTFYTALIPKDGSYLVPLKVVVRKAEGLEDGEMVTVRVEVALTS